MYQQGSRHQHRRKRTSTLQEKDFNGSTAGNPLLSHTYHQHHSLSCQLYLNFCCRLRSQLRNGKHHLYFLRHSLRLQPQYRHARHGQNARTQISMELLLCILLSHRNYNFHYTLLCLWLWTLGHLGRLVAKFIHLTIS